MRIVVDTNVFVSALISGDGASRGILRACLERRLSPLMGTNLFIEYESLMHRGGLFQRSLLDEQERQQFLDAFLSVCHWTQVHFLWRPNLRDEADNHVFELAVAGVADAVVTKNTRDFRGMELQFPEIRIVRPETLIKEIS